MRLADVCIIQTGYTTRGKLHPDDMDGVPVVQMRDFPSGFVVGAHDFPKININADPRYMVGAGDVLFKPRGEKNTAIALSDDFEQMALAILPLIILRPNQNLILPEYLAWAINQRPAQRHFDLGAQGSNMRMVPRSSLISLDVDVPSIKTQRAIVAVDLLAEREKFLSILLAEKHRQLISLILAEQAGNEDPNAGRERNAR